MKPHDIWRNTVTLSCLEDDVISCAALAIVFRLKAAPRVAKISLVAPVIFSVKTSKSIDGCQHLSDNIKLGTLRGINFVSGRCILLT
jgi:hypothetical protein